MSSRMDCSDAAARTGAKVNPRAVSDRPAQLLTLDLREYDTSATVAQEENEDCERFY